jgi:hypothetical protein
MKKTKTLSIQPTDIPKSVGSFHITNIISPPPVKSLIISQLPLLNDRAPQRSTRTTDVLSTTTQQSDSEEKKSKTSQESSSSREAYPSPTAAFRLSATASSNAHITTLMHLAKNLVIKQESKTKQETISPSGPASKATDSVVEVTTLKHQRNNIPGIVSIVQSVFPTDAVKTTPVRPASNVKPTSLTNVEVKGVDKSSADHSEESASMEPSPSMEALSDSTIDSNSASTPTPPPKQGSKLIDKITTLTNRLTKEFAKNLQKIITSVFTEPEASGTAKPATGKPEVHFDHIIPDTVNNLNQMDQHIISILKSNKKIPDGKPTPTSLTPEKSTRNSGIKPTVAGERLADSRTTSAINVPTTTSSSAK